MKNKLLPIILVALTTTSCASMGKGEANYPKTREELEVERVGKLTGEGGLVIFGSKKKGGGATADINVNAYLWRAALDNVYFMPLISADPFGGTILTDWYSSTSTSQERFKLNVLILSNELRSDAIKVSAFKQVRENGVWKNADISPLVAQDIENKILTRARELKVGVSSN